MSEERKWIAADGSEITESMVDSWCDAYEQGDFPAGERSTGDVVLAKPVSSSETVIFTMKIPVGLKQAIEQAAAKDGVSMGAFVRGAVTERLLVS